jgi:transcriptional regulator with XRE-family HTH domain
MMFNMRLKECIEESGMSANKIGEMAGLGHNSIYRIVGGYGVPRRNTVERLADALGVNVEYLMGTSDTKFIVKNEVTPKNAECYNDPTAYKAIKNVETDTGYLRGDIFEYEMKHGKEMRYALVVSANERCNDRFISIVLINDKAMGTNNVSLKVNAMMYADCDRVTFAPSASLKGFVRTATAEEMEEIDKAICMGLGIERIEMPKPDGVEGELLNSLADAKLTIENQKQKMEAMRDEFMNLREGYICKEEKIEKLKAELEKEKNHQIVHSEWNLKFECDFYKKQYESLLAKILERAV